MRRPVTLLVVFAAVAGAVLPAAAVGVSPGVVDSPFGNAQVAGNGSETTPGQQLSGVVGVQGAEIDGEIAERRLAERLNDSPSNASKARVVADQVAALEDRLDRLEERKAALQAAMENGTIGQGEFRARMAELAANVSATRRVLNATIDASEGLPAEVLEANGVNVSAIRELKANASDLAGPEVAAIATSIAGKGAGERMTGPPEFAGPPNGTPGNGPPDDPGGGPPDDPGNGNESGPGGNAPGDSENGTDPGEGPPDDPGGNAPGDSENGTDPGEGPPDDPGNGTDPGEGPPDDPGGDAPGDSENGTDRGGDPPDDPGNGTDPGQGPPGDSGNGTDSNQGPPDDSGNRSDPDQTPPDDSGNESDSGQGPQDGGNDGETGGGNDGGTGGPPRLATSEATTVDAAGPR